MRVPFRINSARCKKCPALVKAPKAQTTQASRRSEQLRLNKGKPTTVNAPLNYFKQREGGPNKSCLRPHNSFK
jgi:hypothetical protein